MSETKYRIIFVDDEVNIVQGLRRMLRKMRNEWDMTFINNGAEALELFQNNGPFDVIVSDMRMPEMDGATLLTEVQKKFPDTVRIILSGYAEQESVFKTVGPAHQYLAKPCDPKILTKTIQQALALRKVLKSEKLQKIITGIQDLPTPSPMFTEFLRVIDSPDSSASSLANIIEKDIAMTTQILKLTNSAYFGLASNVTSSLQAVRLLGFDTIKALVLVVGIFKQFEGDENLTRILSKLSQRSVSIGALAKTICDIEGVDKTISDQACCAGVTSHVGTLLMVAHWPKKYKEAIDYLKNNNTNIIDAEREVFGASHPRVGAYLLGLWGFNDPIVEAVAYHHEPGENSSREFSPLTALHAAQYLMRAENEDLNLEEALPSTFDRDYLSEVGVIDRLQDWRDKVAVINKAKSSGE